MKVEAVFLLIVVAARVSTLLEVLEIYSNYFSSWKLTVSWILLGSVLPFVVDVPDSSCMSRGVNMLCIKSPVENILQLIRIGMILGLALHPVQEMSASSLKLFLFIYWFENSANFNTLWSEARIRIGWNKFRQLVLLLTNKDVSSIMRGRLYSSYVRSSMLHGSQTSPARKENVVALQRAEMRMVRWMWCVKLKDRLPSKEPRERLSIDDIALVAAEQAALVWACAAKRRWRLGEEMYGVWSSVSKTKRKTKEDLERGSPTGLSST